MIIENLKQLVEESKNINKPMYIRNLLKEEVQNYILEYIYNSKKYKDLIFTGGTCLRKVYSLPRLSEDLDFNYFGEFNINEFSTDIELYFQSILGLKKAVAKVSKSQRTIFVKLYFLKDLGLAEPKTDPVLFVRCDFVTDAFGKTTTEVNQITTPNSTFYIKNFDLPTLFSNKIAAFLTREYFKGEDQDMSFKGRDVFDLVWFIQRSKNKDFSLKPNWERLESILETSNRKDIVNKVIEKANLINKNQVYADLAAFVEGENALQGFKENFSQIIEGNFKNIC